MRKLEDVKKELN